MDQVQKHWDAFLGLDDYKAAEVISNLPYSLFGNECLAWSRNAAMQSREDAPRKKSRDEPDDRAL